MTRAKLLRRLNSDPHLWILYVAALYFILRHFLYERGLVSSPPPPDALLIFITLAILVLLADHIWETAEAKEKAEANAARLNTISQAVLDKRVALRSRPSKAEEYAYLWGGYTETYYVYNPSYHVDKNVKEEEIVKMFVHRYEDPQFLEARYIFLTGDTSGKEDLARFCRLMTLVKQRCPEIEKKILLKVIPNKESASTCEMYLGTRYGNDRAVMELKEPVMVSQHGMPHYYLVIDDTDIYDHYLKDHFEPAWESADIQELSVTSLFAGTGPGKLSNELVP